MTSRILAALALLTTLLFASPGLADAPKGAPDQAVGATSDDAALAATTDKFNAYVAYMNRTLRAVDSLDRYKSWVNMKTGPTGHERLIYGLYGVYDVTDERAAAEKELPAKPLLPDLDDAMRAYIAANDTLAPILNKADGYYSRKDYEVDHMAGGKVFHQQIVSAGDTFLAARAHLDTVMTTEKLQLDTIRLATIEKREGRDANWHVANVMMRAKQSLDALQAGQHGDVDMAVFNTDMTNFGDAVRGMDDYNADHPGSFAAFEVFPDEMLGSMRDVQKRLERSHGNLRSAAAFDLQMVLTMYNTMVTTSETATQFAK